MIKPAAAYTWDDSQRKISVTVTIATAARTAGQVTGKFSPRQNVYPMSRAQFHRFQAEFAKICDHPGARIYTWIVDSVLYAGCCDCGQVLQQTDLARR